MKYRIQTLKCILLLAFLSLGPSLFAHNINYALEKAPKGEVIWYYLVLGIEHIIPAGLDHILFIIGICLLNSKLKTLLWQATAFTIAHSITLALSLKNVIDVPGAIVEPIISLSIVFVAVENILTRELKPWRIAIIFLFGLVHGMGFANALNEIGLPRNQFYTSVISFNLGVELGQIAVILLVFLLIIMPFGKKTWFRRYLANPLSACIALIALYWTFDRLLQQ